MLSSPRGRTMRLWSSLLAFAIGACGGGSDPSVPTEISLNTSTLAFTSIGATQQLTATVLDQDGNPLSGAQVTWSSSSDAVATVSPTGLVTATGPGTAEITATSGEATGTAEVSVTQELTAFEQASGNGQAAVAGQALAQPLVVRARDASGSPIPNVAIQFQVTQGGGSVVPAETQTSPDGTASTVFTVGPTAGQAQQVAVSAVGTAFSTTFSASATNPAAAIEVSAGNGQNAPAGGHVPVSPAVRVLDASDDPVSGVQVRFEVTSGGGAVSGNVKATGADGVATLDTWTLGPTGVNTLSVTVDGQTVAGEPLTFVATTDASTGYNIKIQYIGTPSSSQLLAFAEAEIRWEGLITGDLADIPLDLPATPHPCGDGLPAISETVDDLLILADLQPIDGPGAVLGRAGPCLTRLSDQLPVLGVMLFDTDDLEDLEAFDLLADVVVHEMGHTMGIGTLWAEHGLLADPAGQGGTDPHFTGAQAIAAFDAAGGTDYPDEKVPVETEGGPGTEDSHWRETVFDNELMTGFINQGANPLSAVTVRSLADQGYTVNPAGADPYTLPLPGVRAGARGRMFVLQGDALRLPVRRVDQAGRLREAPAR